MSEATDSNEPQPGFTVVVRGRGDGFAQQIVTGPHSLAGDEPVESGGTGTGPGPYDFLLAALGT